MLEQQNPPQAVSPAAPAPVRQHGTSAAAQPAGSFLGPYELPELIGLACVAAVVAVIFGALLMRSRRLGRELASAQRRIGAALRKPDLPLDRVPAEIKSIERMMSDLLDERLKLRSQLQAVSHHHVAEESSPQQRRAAAVAECLEEAAKAVEALDLDPDFRPIEQTLALGVGLKNCARALRELPRAAFGAELFKLLESGRLDLALTTHGLFDAYFSDRLTWRTLRTVTRAADALLRSLLEANDVQITQVPIFSVVGPSDLRDSSVSDRRKLRQIPTIQQKAARLARDLQASELLVVDYHGPGWTSARNGSRQPSVAIFDPASWT